MTGEGGGGGGGDGDEDGSMISERTGLLKVEFLNRLRFLAKRSIREVGKPV